jgi:hypothetical protein
MPHLNRRSKATLSESTHISRETSGASEPSSRKSSAATLRKLRQAARAVRSQVAQDREAIAAEARDVIATAVAQGKMTKLTVLLRQDEQPVLAAMDEYAATHGLRSRNQVLRAALANLLKIELNRPHWGWSKGRARKA